MAKAWGWRRLRAAWLAVGLCAAGGAGADPIIGNARDAEYFPWLPGAQERMRTPACQAFYAYAFEQPLKDTIRTDGLVVVKGGKLVYEGYRPAGAPGALKNVYYGSYSHDLPHILWSASKSVTSAIFGALEHKSARRISRDTPLTDFFPTTARPEALRQDPHEAGYANIKLGDLLTMGAGFQWNESYESDPKTSSVTRLLYTNGFKDMAAFALTRPMAKDGPGGRYEYSSGNSSILFAAVRKFLERDGGAAGVGPYADLPWTVLFDRLGMKNGVFETDVAGNFVGSSYVHMRPIDMAKVGYLYLKDGMWEGQRVLPEGWVAWTREPAKSYLAPATVITNPTNEGVFGGTWWLNLPVKGNGKPYPRTTEDFYGAFGHYGQYIFVVPSMDLVIARTADDRDPHAFSVDTWMTHAKECFQ